MIINKTEGELQKLSHHILFMKPLLYLIFKVLSGFIGLSSTLQQRLILKR